MTRTLGYFVAGTFAGLAVLAAVFFTLYGEYGLLCVAAAGTICILPTLASLALSLWSRGRSGSELLMAVVGGMALRMGVVFALSLPLFLSVARFRETKERELVFWSAVLICYMGTLAWETFLSARAKNTVRDAGRTPVAGGVGE